ncbi:MAG TPA: hypothetical protein VND93_22150 [Myxococcales bacterium]|nr:hypothetical protein [Myxococcales bacterium]
MAAVEITFLSALSTYLSGLSIAPKPKVGTAEPAAGTDLPAVVLSLEQSARPSVGLGDQGSLVKKGALSWSAQIDLGSPYLPDDPLHTFSLVSGDRFKLTLPHGGLVHQDGTTGGPLLGTDLQVAVGGANRPVVSGTPSGLEVKPDPATGVLTFATALPLNGMAVANYYLGQWERRVERLNGVLRLEVCAATAADAQAVADGVLNALLDPSAKQGVPRLISISLQGLGSVGGPEQVTNARRRKALLQFQYEHDVDRPESAGGVIQGIPITANVGLPE